MDVNTALGYIADGHAVYSEEAGKEVMEAFGLQWRPKYASVMFSDPPGTFKGLVMEKEGERGITALSLGSIILRELNLKAESKMGRGFQGRANAEAIRQHFSQEVSQ